MEARLAASTKVESNRGDLGLLRAPRASHNAAQNTAMKLARRDILDNDGLSGRTSHPLCEYSRRRIISRPSSERH